MLEFYSGNKSFVRVGDTVQVLETDQEGLTYQVYYFKTSATTKDQIQAECKAVLELLS